MFVQEDLFGQSRGQTLRFRVKELDSLISKAMKTKNFSEAKRLTELQEKIIQELVAKGDSEASPLS